jgi:hypothetical protein
MTIQSILASTYYGEGGGGSSSLYPTPGSGSYLTSAGPAGTALNPTDPGGAITTISNPQSGWAYYIKDGQFNNDTTFFNGVSVTGTDTYGGFGNQFLDREYYAMQWVGYIYIPATATYRMTLTADDLLYFWIGTNALDGNFNFNNWHHQVSNNSQYAPDLSLTGNSWYPIRMMFQEFSGAENAQVFLGPDNGTLLSISSYSTSHNSATGGH